MRCDGQYSAAQGVCTVETATMAHVLTCLVRAMLLFYLMLRWGC